MFTYLQRYFYNHNTQQHQNINVQAYDFSPLKNTLQAIRNCLNQFNAINIIIILFLMLLDMYKLPSFATDITKYSKSDRLSLFGVNPVLYVDKQDSGESDFPPGYCNLSSVHSFAVEEGKQCGLLFYTLSNSGLLQLTVKCS